MPDQDAPKPKPWEAAGMSKRTWYRRQAGRLIPGETLAVPECPVCARRRKAKRERTAKWRKAKAS